MKTSRIATFIQASKLHKVKKALDAEYLGRRWWLVMPIGILLIVSGVLILFNPSGLIIAIGINFGLNIIVTVANLIAAAV